MHATDFQMFSNLVANRLQQGEGIPIHIIIKEMNRSLGGILREGTVNISLKNWKNLLNVFDVSRSIVLEGQVV